MLPVPACPACRAPILETPLPTECPSCGESLGPSAEPTPWSAQATPTPYGFTGVETPHGFGGLRTPVNNPWAHGRTPTPLPWSIDTGDLPPTPEAEVVEDASDWPVVDPALRPPASINPIFPRPPSQPANAVDKNTLFDDLDLTPAELLLVGAERRRSVPASRSAEPNKLVVIRRDRRRIETLVRENTIGVHIDIAREVVAGAPSWVVRGLPESKARLLVAKLAGSGISARVVDPRELEDGRSPRNRAYAIEVGFKLGVAVLLVLFLVILVGAEYVSPIVGDWTLELRAEVVSAFEP